MKKHYFLNVLLTVVLLFSTSQLFAQNKITSFPYEESFESGFGDWTQSTDDAFDWTQNSGTTGSSNTGANAAFDGTYYIYTESSGNFNNDTYLDASFDFSSLSYPYLTFYYHMYGSSMGSLHVDIWDGTWNEDVFVLEGQQQTYYSSDWKNTYIDLSSYAGMDSVVVRLRGITGSSWQSDICIDKIEMFEGTDMSYSTSIINQPIETNLNQNSTDNIIAVIEVTTDGLTNPLEINSFNLASTGSDDFSHDVSNINIYYTQTDSIFSTDSIYGFATDLSSPISGLVELDPGKNYFWVTYDITEDATPENKIDVECTNIAFVGTTGDQVPTSTNAEKYRSIEPAMIYTSGIVNQPIETNINQNSTDNIIAVIEVTTENLSNPLEINSFNLNSNGSDDFSNDISNVNIYYTQTDSIFRTDSIYGTATDLNSPISGFVELDLGKNYFWVTYDITEDAIPENRIDVECTNIAFNGATGNHVPTSTNADRFRSIDPIMKLLTESCFTASTNDVMQNRNDFEIIGINVQTENSSNPVMLSELKFKPTGSDDFINDVSKVNVYYTANSAEFNTDSLFGTANVNDTIVTGSQELQAGDNYLWITYDIYATASVGNKVDAECHYIMIDDVKFFPTDSAPAGNRTIEEYSNYYNFMPASIVVGQPDFYTQNTNLDEYTGYGSNSSAVSAKGALAVGSQSAGRILIWNSVPDTNGTPADFVIGQPDFYTARDYTVSATKMISLEGVCFSPDGEKLIASDGVGNRVLIWNSIPTSNAQPADVVIGQTDFTSSGSGVGPNKLNYPGGVIVTSDGKLIINEFENNRVLIFNQIPTINGASADVVIGQDDFYSNTSGTGSNKINQTWYSDVSLDGKLLIGDITNNRVLIFNSIPTTNGASADVVIGQNDFTTNTSGLSDSTFNIPIGITVSPKGELAIAEFSNNRVLIFKSIPTENNAKADFVLGQPDFNSNAGFNGGINEKSMYGPYGINFDLNGRLYVNGRNMHRVMIYGDLPTDSADVEISITADKTNPHIGEAITYTFTLSNNGPSSTSDVVVKSAMPSLFELENYTAEKGEYQPFGGTWDIPFLASGKSINLILEGTVKDGSDEITAYSNIIASSALDGNMDNNATSLTIDVINEAPTVTALENDTIVQGTSTDWIPFTINDIDTEMSNLELVATSSDQTIVPDVNIQISGESNDRFIKITPLTDQAGAVYITLTVSDGYSENQSTFELYILSNNAKLTNLDTSATTITGFDADSLTYTCELTAGTMLAPTVTALAENNNAQVNIFETDTIPGITTVEVIAEDGTVQNYLVTFILPVLADNDASLTDLKVDGNTIEGFSPIKYHYTQNLSYGTAVVPTINAIPKNASASIDLNQTTALPGRDSITVTAVDGLTEQVYTIDYVVTGASDNNNLQKITIDGEEIATFDSELLEYTFEYPYGTTVVPTVIAIPEDVNAFIDQTDAASMPGTTTLNVYAEDASLKTYTIEFTLAAPSEDASLENIKVGGVKIFGFDSEVYSYDVELEPNVTKVPEVTATANNDSADLVINDATAIPGTTSIIVTAQDGTTELTYNVNFTYRPLSDVSLLSDLKVDGATVDGFDPEVYSYIIKLPIDEITPPLTAATVYDKKSSLKITNATKIPGTTNITVTAEDGSTSEYLVNFIFLNSDATLNDIKVNDNSIAEFEASTLTYTIELAYATTEVPTITTVETDVNANSEITDASELPGTTTIFVTAEDGVTTETYEVEFTIADPNTDATLSDLKVDGTSLSNFNSATLSYDIELASKTTTVPTVTATTNDANADVVITDATSLPGTTTIVVTAEDETTEETYSINFTVATAIEELDFDRNISLYPNPTNGIVNISFEDVIQSQWKIEVYNSIGSLIYTEELTRIDKTEYKVDLSNFSKGMYFIKISTNNESCVKNLIVK